LPRDLLRGHEALRAGRTEEAAVAYRAALACPAMQPFARYALACLGQDDHAAVLAGQPGLFLALRCRAWLTQERFRQRQATPAEGPDPLPQAAAAGFQAAPADHFRRLAVALQPKQPSQAEMRALTADLVTTPDAFGGNLLRAALELATRLPPE